MDNTDLSAFGRLMRDPMFTTLMETWMPARDRDLSRNEIQELAHIPKLWFGRLWEQMLGRKIIVKSADAGAAEDRYCLNQGSPIVQGLEMIHREMSK